ncbi:adenylate/guanylate cyclase domain-containing protein [Labilibacter marinus]|uniref:adenylate/guanylate cyclase domain-containing protein n=1 Tax=Labilibacter marinus TaxID=1477105 RepID=UPI000A6C8035|nr:adenylate/guanylate cyclase domain-containing protein [Labilibacter marinus]
MREKLFNVEGKYAALIVLYVLLIQGDGCFANNVISFSEGKENLINSIIVSGDTVDFNQNMDTLVLKEAQFEYLEINFIPKRKEKIQLYRFRLEGVDSVLSNWSYKNSVTYSRIPTGSYNFIIESEDDSQSLIILVTNNYNRYLISSIVLLFIILFSIFLLKLRLSQSVSKKMHSWRKDSIAPIIEKYIKKKEPEQENSQTLTHRASVKYEKATVLFADIQGFTKIVEHMNPETLIDELDRFFVHFDEVAEKYKIEKIKTIGDAYMCAGGLPEKNRTNPIEVVLAAIEMQRFMQETGEDAQRSGKDFWELRIGIHTGALISGVIGRKKLSFDIWGDTVNIASRMESSGVAGKINVSGVTYQLIKDFFECEYRGKMPIKYKGETDMYFVKGIKPKLSIDGQGKVPNDDFLTKLQWIRYNDLEDAVFGQMRQELASSLKYHNISHTMDVCTQVEVFGRAEGLNSKELLLLKTAALFHDTGYMVNPHRHEQQSVRIAKEMLPHFSYSIAEIEAIAQLILVTESDVEPKILMEKIIKDADLDYLGRADFIPLSEKLWEELCNYNGKISQKEWNKKQYAFISRHVYYTETARKLRQVNKEMQLKKIEELLK